MLPPLLSGAQNRYDVLITEFLADPSPSVGLPESSFIELKNHSSENYNLHNWKISNGSTTATIKSDYDLKPDSFLILCPSSAVGAYGLFGPTLGLSGFPSLYNQAGEIILSAGDGRVIHAIRYDQASYRNNLKADGGWSLEMIDLNNACSHNQNWTASISPSGGTPGAKNSVDGANPDVQPPALLRFMPVDSVHLILLFDEAMDSSSASSPENYSIGGMPFSPDTVTNIPPFFDRVLIHVPEPMQQALVYTFMVQHVADCSGNEIGSQNSCPAGLPKKVNTGDIIFNEILFNPPAYGYDYIELYNRSSSIIRCTELFLAGRDPLGNLKDPVNLVKEERVFFPGDYLVLTENPEWLKKNYPPCPASQIILLNNLPSMPDDFGKLILLSTSGDILDELDYDHHWHSPLLASESGISLERIRTDLPTNQPSNWTSASSPSGYGTPGYQNSEFAKSSENPDNLSVDPKIFSPDMDGYQDFCFINYQLPAAGYIGSISVYDIYGRLVRQLVNNILWGSSGSFRWDGRDEQQNLLPMGHYIFYCELFLPDGRMIKKKLVCVLARKN
jgi:hypothetical protein